MKEFLTQLCSPLLNLFDKGQAPANYKASHRSALTALGVLFLFLSGVAFVTGYYAGSLTGAIIPVIAFFCLGTVAVLIGTLGSNSAVSNIWGTK